MFEPRCSQPQTLLMGKTADAARRRSRRRRRAQGFRPGIGLFAAVLIELRSYLRSPHPKTDRPTTHHHNGVYNTYHCISPPHPPVLHTGGTAVFGSQESVQACLLSHPICNISHPLPGVPTDPRALEHGLPTLPENERYFWACHAFEEGSTLTWWGAAGARCCCCCCS